MPNQVVTTANGGLQQNPAGQLMLGSALVMGSIPGGVSEVIPAGYQLVVHGLQVDGVLDMQGALVLV